jgi:large subunit ribosomal protein L6
VLIPKGVTVQQSGCTLKAAGPQGSLQLNCHPEINVKIEGERILVTNPRPASRQYKAMHGTTRALIVNMITGVNEGFERKMELYGMGYNVKEQGGKLVLQAGFANPVEIAIPQGVKVRIETPATRGNDAPAKFTLSGPDKAIIGQFAANIRRVNPPEPYKGKGIRYADEQVKRKVGKAFASGPA